MTLICPECLGEMRYSYVDAMYICSHCGHEDDGEVDDYVEPDDGYWQEYARLQDKNLYVDDGVPF